MLTPLHGLSMALADSVPGISGGTIAFILGFYDKFINSLHDVVGGDKQKRKEAIFYLIKFAIGWGIGMIACILLLSVLFEEHVYFLASLFLGLTAIAIPIIIIEERECLKGKYINLVFTALGVALVVGLTLSRSMIEGFSAMDFTALEIWHYFYLFIVGMVAISAMVLPGISGSTVLLIAGVYIPILNGVKTLLTFNFSVFPGLLCFGMGIIIGILLSVRLISHALKKHRSGMVYFILGLMVGSFVAIVTGPTTLTPPQESLSISTFHWWGFALGVVLLLALEFVKYFKEQKNTKS